MIFNLTVQGAVLYQRQGGGSVGQQEETGTPGMLLRSSGIMTGVRFPSPSGLLRLLVLVSSFP